MSGEWCGVVWCVGWWWVVGGGDGGVRALAVHMFLSSLCPLLAPVSLRSLFSAYIYIDMCRCMCFYRCISMYMYLHLCLYVCLFVEQEQKCSDPIGDTWEDSQRYLYNNNITTQATSDKQQATPNQRTTNKHAHTHTSQHTRGIIR